LDDLLPHVNAALRSDNPRVVLDNTYGTWVSRWPLLRLARARGVPVVCHYLNTPASEALTNIVLRVWQRYGKLLGPDELKEFSKTDGNLPPPAALAKFFAKFEAPSLSEGFAKIDETHFQRDYTHGLNGRQKALLLDVDGTLRVTKSGEPYPTDPNDIEILSGRREKLLDYIARDYQLFLVSNQSGVAGGKLTESDAKACFERTIELLDVPIRAVSFCPHPAFPTSCFCRKPMPGLGIALALQHQLDVRAWIMVGDMESDREFAAAIGAEYHEAGEFFA
jgi:HAD superfamily hydrolase (TIGR01662 family)